MPECNIGPEETRRRQRTGFAGIILAVLTILAIWMLELSPGFRWILFFPVAMAFSGFLQARSRFCMLYGIRGVTSLSGLQHFRASLDIPGDRERAIRLFGQVVLFSALVTIGYVLLA